MAAVIGTGAARKATRRRAALALALVCALLLAGRAQSQPARPSAVAADTVADTVEVVNRWPHDPGAYTQGLVFHEGKLLESTGLYGESTVREVELESGAVLRSVAVPQEYFGEGLTLFAGRLVQLTWREERGFVYRLEDLARVGEFTYRGEGWGLTHDGARLIMSDGTNRLRFLDPATFAVVGTLDVSDGFGPVWMLNELEWVRGEIWANIYLTDRIARIDPGSGRVLGYLDLTGLLPDAERLARRVDVLNGIAYDPVADRIFVTGKWWPLLFEIRPREAAPRSPEPAPESEGVWRSAPR